jgi:hypothetical protein
LQETKEKPGFAPGFFHAALLVAAAIDSIFAILAVLI